MNEGDKVWLSRESFETLSHALQNMQIRQDLTILSPRITFSGSGKGASLFLDLPPSSRGQSEYMGNFKIVDRSHTIEQDRDVSYDKRLYKIAVCDGASYNESIPSSNPSYFYLNEEPSPGRAFPYTESQPFTGGIWDKYVVIEAKFKWTIGEEEEESGEEEEFTPEYKVYVNSDNFGARNSYDYRTGLITCSYPIGRIHFQEYMSKKSNPILIRQDHLAGPIRMFWYLAWQDLEREEEEEAQET